MPENNSSAFLSFFNAVAKKEKKMIVYLHGLLTKNKDGYFHITENKCDGL